MSRTAILFLVVLVLGGALYVLVPKRPSEPLLIEVENFAEGTVVFDVGELSTRTQSLIYTLFVTSRTKETVHLKVRVAAGATEGFEARVSAEVPVRPAGRESARLVIAPPPRLGPFEAKVILFADELPGWTLEYQFRGSVAEKPLRGKYVGVRPPGIDLGAVRAGEIKKFEFEVYNFGNQPILVSEIRALEPEVVQLTGIHRDVVVTPDEPYRVEGEARISGQGGQFRSRIQIDSDADNAKRLKVSLQATLRRDYDVSPDRLPTRTVYSTQSREYTIQVSAVEGVAPFVIDAVKGLEPLFELSQPLGTEPAAAQTISLRLRSDAPTGPEAITGTLRISIDPSHVMLEWPYALQVLPPVNATPASVNFGTVGRDRLDKPLERRVQVAALPGRPIAITGVRAERGYFHVRVAEHMTGLPWEVIVVLPALADVGVYRDQILIETSDPDVPKISIPVRANVRQ